MTPEFVSSIFLQGFITAIKLAGPILIAGLVARRSGQYVSNRHLHQRDDSCLHPQNAGRGRRLAVDVSMDAGGDYHLHSKSFHQYPDVRPISENWKSIHKKGVAQDRHGHQYSIQPDSVVFARCFSGGSPYHDRPHV